jgi:hypothetical protein
MTACISRHGLLYIDLPLQKPSAKNSRDIAFLQYELANASHKHTIKAAHPHRAFPFVTIATTHSIPRSTPRPQNPFAADEQLQSVQYPRVRILKGRLILTHDTTMDMRMTNPSPIA